MPHLLKLRQDLLNFQKTVAFFKKIWYNVFVYGVWRSLVARTAGGREVAGSNPVAPIFLSVKKVLSIMPGTFLLPFLA